jgi:hypothetical protein
LWEGLGRGLLDLENDLLYRIAAIDEEPAAGHERGLDRRAGENAGLGMAAVERADADGDGEVIGCFAGLEGEAFGGAPAKFECAGGDLGG